MKGRIILTIGLLTYLYYEFLGPVDNVITQTFVSVSQHALLLTPFHSKPTKKEKNNDYHQHCQCQVAPSLSTLPVSLDQFFWPTLTSPIDNTTYQPAWKTCEWGKISTSPLQGTGIYPLSIDDFERSFRISNVEFDACPFQNVIRKANRNETVHIAVIGGSMTAGNECLPKGVTGIPCPWSSQLAMWLPVVFPHWKFVVTNHAVPAWSAAMWSTSGKIKTITADIWLIDVSVNSQGLPGDAIMDGIDHLLWQIIQPSATDITIPQPAILVLESFRTCSIDITDCMIHCDMDTEGNIAPDGNYFCNSWHQIQNVEEVVVRHYMLPLASYRDAVWPVLTTPPVELGNFWNGLSHPDRASHEYVSDIVKHALYRLLKSTPPPLSTSSPPSADSICRSPPLKPLTFSGSAHASCVARDKGVLIDLGAHKVDEFIPISQHNWARYEDRPRKPGWIGFNGDFLTRTTTTTPSITFAVKFSTVPQLEVVFLRSYWNMSSVVMTLDGVCLERNGTSASATWRLDGCWNTGYSLPVLFQLRAPEDGKEAETNLDKSSQRGNPQMIEGFFPNYCVPKPDQTYTLKFDMLITKTSPNPDDARCTPPVSTAKLLKTETIETLVSDPGKFKLIRITSC